MQAVNFPVEVQFITVFVIDSAALAALAINNAGTISASTFLFIIYSLLIIISMNYDNPSGMTIRY